MFQTLGRLCALAAAGLAVPALAADHNEAPGALADRIADIADLYTWQTNDGKIVAIITFGGVGAEPIAPPVMLDADVLYGIHVDADGDFLSDTDVWARFGQDSTGAWGVQVQGLPGATGDVVGPIGTRLDAGNGLSIQAGVFDDPFFFDATGLGYTLATGDLSFDMTRDSFAGRNINALIVEMDAATVATAGDIVRIWTTTARK